MTGGDLKIEVLPAGAVVPAFGLLEAVSKGTLDGGHGVLVYHYGKQTALALWGSGPGYGMDANMLLVLAQIRRRQGAARRSSTPRSAPTSCRSPTGRCRPSRSAGSRSRSPRSTISRASSTAPSASRSTCSQAMGAAVNALPGGEIVSAMDRGLLDAAEFNNASSDRIAGLRRRLEGLHAAELPPERRAVRDHCSTRTKYDALPDKMKAIIANAVEARQPGHVVEGDRPLLAGLRRAADQGQGQVLQDARRRS